jgi:hypothetical protein
MDEHRLVDIDFPGFSQGREIMRICGNRSQHLPILYNKTRQLATEGNREEGILSTVHLHLFPSPNFAPVAAAQPKVEVEEVSRRDFNSWGVSLNATYL